MLAAKVVIGIVVLLMALAIAGKVENAGAVGVSPSVPCEEDMPCWDCNTMGNLICGEGVG